MELWSIYQPIFLCEKREVDHTTTLLPLLSSVLIILKKVLLLMFPAVNLRRTSLTCSSRLTLRPSTNSTEVRHRVIMMIIKVVMLGFFFCILYTCSRVSPESDLIKPSSWTCWYILIFVAVVPVRKVHALTISWAVPPQGKHYRWVQHSFTNVYRCRGWLDLLMNQ